ncbi:hypothetical protein BN7_344 [Wickerhamomyces ciferrii]|uniref:Uncharacterized protein n=1 Tax=Wickerhamomyces ciferrii (strain ATCC 14091 / BCRC 22168 / CBS 111 / JCM 3599 / NBRC 0793 / NRRL Y-1031 F-60-10) TaxID=1206466 RepID=K0K7M3_WICCF|nr:uncharacterized protein BN7_344 [Wickerhamomyces ciferrii]CCH40810.1 hypothetical protein BN7_344 [Wickerhamomyces ciferrii]
MFHHSRKNNRASRQSMLDKLTKRYTSLRKSAAKPAISAELGNDQDSSEHLLLVLSEYDEQLYKIWKAHEVNWKPFQNL